MSQVNFSEITAYLQSLQNKICSSLANIDGKESFHFDRWDKSGSKGLQGYGISAVIKDGGIFEKGGVNFSCVEGEKLPGSASANRGEIANKPFKAAGVSLVMHPENPYIPTTHANVRFFSAGDEKPVWWFGGGYDLTPYYAFEEDCKHWHQTAKNACEPFGEDVYPNYKKWCDEYFFLKHRDEHRGIGGLFFDDLNDWGFEKSFAFMQSVGDSFLDAYLPIVERRRNTPYGERERNFQVQRRGRYVEFNLVYDRGTLFGLQSGGRTEAILMSMPPLVSWDYCASYPEGSEEDKLTSYFLKTRDWV